MFRKAVSTLEGVKAGELRPSALVMQADCHRCSLQLSTAFQPCCRYIHVADELYTKPEMVSYIEQCISRADKQVP